jgi:hypothetical protein
MVYQQVLGGRCAETRETLAVLILRYWAVGMDLPPAFFHVTKEVRMVSRETFLAPVHAIP